MGGSSVEYPIQRAKVQRPPLRDETLARERLLEWLTARIGHRVILVSAEAGYGKTTLLADFARRSRVRVLWYRIDEEDADWIAFLNYLVAAGREVDPTFAPSTAAMLRDLGSRDLGRDAIVDSLVREFSRLGDVPTLLILDDFHHLDRVPELRAIARELVHRAGPGLTVVIASRQRPSLGLARLRAAGDVAELTTRDLRFSEDEIERLFRESYGRPLEPDVLAELSRRTEGWVASLALAQAALRDRTGGDIRLFVQRLSGAWEGLYEYLAEEVVGDLDADSQQFLMRTSILGAVDPESARLVTGLDVDTGRRMLETAERLGLVARRGESSITHRYHPLVRGFLEDRLRRADGDETVMALHRLVARDAETRDWRVAAHHYAAVGDSADLHRVIADHLDEILATGDFAAAEGFLDRHPPAHHDPLLEVILSRRDFYQGRPERAVSRARAASGALSPEQIGGGAALVNLASLEYMTGQGQLARQIAPTLRDRVDNPTLSDIGVAMEMLVEAADRGSIDRLADHLALMARVQENRGETHYLAVTLVNLAVCRRAQGAARECLEDATRAVAMLDGGEREPELAAALGCRAWALAWLGQWSTALSEIQRADDLRNEYARSELLTDAIDLQAWFGDAAGAEGIAHRTRALRGTPVTLEDARLARAELDLRLHRTDRARVELNGSVLSATGVAHAARLKALCGHLALMEGDDTAVDLLDDARSHAAEQGALVLAHYCGLLIGSRLGASPLAAAIADAVSAVGPGVLSMVAERIVPQLSGLPDPIRAIVHAEADRRPDRWRQPARDIVDGSTGAPRRAAAELLERVGRREDVPRLRAVARADRSTATAGLGKGLARRLAPRIYIEDQGRLEFRIGDEVVAGSRIRRRVLALVCYLLTRPGMSATREQAVETLWTDLDPAVALNSLNQSVYFLRRGFEPGVRDDASAGYIHQDQDLVWLDRDLVISRSVDCRELMRSMGPDPTPEQIEDLSLRYRGAFAMDFEYEDWAAEYRMGQHARYLQIMERAIGMDAASGHNERAIVWAQRALDVDPSADAIEAMLIRLYRRIGSPAAAAEQYAHYSAVMRDQLGVEPPSIEHV